MKKTLLLSIVLGVLVLVSLVQAFQLNGLKETVADAELSIGSAESTTPAKSGSSSSTSTESSSTTKKSNLPSSIKDLPTMVGGC